MLNRKKQTQLQFIEQINELNSALLEKESQNKKLKNELISTEESLNYFVEEKTRLNEMVTKYFRLWEKEVENYTNLEKEYINLKNKIKDITEKNDSLSAKVSDLNCQAQSNAVKTVFLAGKAEREKNDLLIKNIELEKEKKLLIEIVTQLTAEIIDLYREKNNMEK